MMKTKLTLSIEKRIVDSAKRLARRRKTSVSKLFEEIFEGNDVSPIKTTEQIAAEELLRRVGPGIEASEKSDKELIREHLKKKYG